MRVASTVAVVVHTQRPTAVIGSGVNALKIHIRGGSRCEAGTANIAVQNANRCAAAGDIAAIVVINQRILDIAVELGQRRAAGHIALNIDEREVRFAVSASDAKLIAVADREVVAGIVFAIPRHAVVTGTRRAGDHLVGGQRRIETHSVATDHDLKRDGIGDREAKGATHAEESRRRVNWRISETKGIDLRRLGRQSNAQSRQGALDFSVIRACWIDAAEEDRVIGAVGGYIGYAGRTKRGDWLVRTAQTAIQGLPVVDEAASVGEKRAGERINAGLAQAVAVGIGRYDAKIRKQQPTVPVAPGVDRPCIGEETAVQIGSGRSDGRTHGDIPSRHRVGRGSWRADISVWISATAAGAEEYAINSGTGGRVYAGRVTGRIIVAGDRVRTRKFLCARADQAGSSRGAGKAGRAGNGLIAAVAEILRVVNTNLADARRCSISRANQDVLAGLSIDVQKGAS